MADSGGAKRGFRPLRLRDSVLVFNRDCRMQFICTMELRVLEFDVSPFVIELISLLDGSNSVERIESILEGSAGFTRTSLENVLARGFHGRSAGGGVLNR